MSEHTIDNAAEISTADVVDQATTPIEDAADMQPISTVADELPTDGVVEKLTKKQRVDHFVRSHTFAKVRDILIFVIRLVLPALCTLQMVIWGLEIAADSTAYGFVFRSGDWVNIMVILASLAFVIPMFVHSILDVVHTLKRQDEVLFETVATYFAFFIFKVFVKNFFGSRSILLTDLTFLPILIPVLVLIVAYAVIRLFSIDIWKRLFSVTVSASVIVALIILFVFGVGNFVTFTVDTDLSSSVEMQASGMNFCDYWCALYDGDEMFLSDESYLISANENFSLGMDDLNGNAVFPFLQMIIIFMANTLPYMMLSLISYLLFGLMNRNYIQYAKIYACRRATIAILVGTGLSLLASIGMGLIFNLQNGGVTVQFHYVNMVVTVVAFVGLLIALALPWSRYMKMYRSRYADYQKNAGGK